MVQVKNLTIRHRKDNRVLLEDFSMVLNPGDKAAISGEEGNGKATLSRQSYDEALVDDYIDYSGEIIRNNARLSYLAQELTEAEREEQAQLRREYIAEWRNGVMQVLDNTYVVDKNGIKHKLQKKQPKS